MTFLKNHQTAIYAFAGQIIGGTVICGCFIILVSAV